MSNSSAILPQSVLDAIQNPFVIKNANGIVIACNQAFQKHYDLGENRILGFTSYDFAPRKEAVIHVQADVAILSGAGSYLDYRITRDRPDGTILQLDVHKSSSFSENGSLQILSVVNTQIQPCGGVLHNYLLTPRETGVLKLLVQGNSQKHIARALGISHFTVSDHLKAIYGKLGVTSRTQAQLKAIVELGMR